MWSALRWGAGLTGGGQDFCQKQLGSFPRYLLPVAAVLNDPKSRGSLSLV